MRLFSVPVVAVLLLASEDGLGAESGSVQIPAAVGATTTMTVNGKTGASYELYLPTSYPSTKPKTPVVFAFSPIGSGSNMVRVLKSSCEKSGWVIIGCNRLRNGNDPMDRLMEWEILRDVRQRIPHDREREYLAGFSGGASRSYAMTRSFWNEFAGVIAFGGWLEIYRPELVYPSRLAVAFLNGSDDRGATQRAESDPAILHQFQIRTKVFTFPGGHVMAPPATVDEGVQWLEEDWRVNQAAKVSATKGRSESLLKQAKAALGEGRHGPTLETLTQIILEFSFTPAASTADEMIAGILNNGMTRTNALRSFPLAGNPRVGQILLARAEDRDGFPAAQRVANCELAFAANPLSASAAAQLASALTESDDAKLRDPERAEYLAAFASGRDAESWYAWNVRATIAEQKGQRESAVEFQQKALDLVPRYLKKTYGEKLARLRL